MTLHAQTSTLGDLPGAALVLSGLEALQALARGDRADFSQEALLVAIGAKRLRAAGLAVPHAPGWPKHPELALYRAIGDTHSDAHSRYNALVRRLVSFERALEARNHRAGKGAATLAGRAPPASGIAATASVSATSHEPWTISYKSHGRSRTNCMANGPPRSATGAFMLAAMYHDEISRIAFGEPDMVRHLLALLPADAIASLDTRRLRPLPTEQVGRGVRKRLPDMAWAVGAPTPQRPDAEALLAIEFQSARHEHMALRMAAYAALLRQRMADALPAGADLPPVLPVLVYTGDRQWTPPSLRERTAPTAAGLRRWQPELEMLMLDAAALRVDDGDINPAAALLRLQSCRRADELSGLAAALFGALRRDGKRRLAERLGDALAHMLVARFGGDGPGEEHADELRRALRHMEEPRMLAETFTRWRDEWLDEGRQLGMSEGERALLRRLAARRFGIATGDALAALLANEEDVERLEAVGVLVVGCANSDELLRRGKGLLNGGQ